MVMGSSSRSALLPFLRHDDIASCRSDFEHYRREGFPVYSLKRDEKRAELLDLLVADHAGIIDENGRIKQTMHGLSLAWHYHPCAWNIKCGNRKTPIELFSDDLLFVKAIERRTKLGNAFSDGGLRKILRTFSSTSIRFEFPTNRSRLRVSPIPAGERWSHLGHVSRIRRSVARCPRVRPSRPLRWHRSLNLRDGWSSRNG